MEMDTTLIAAIVTSLATIIAAYVTVNAVKETNKNLEEGDKYSIFNSTYTILYRELDNKVIAIKDGFSWVGFLFHILWIFYSKLWETIFTTLLIVGGIFIHLYIIDYTSNNNFLEYYIKLLASMFGFIGLILGMFGNRLLIRKYAHSFCLLDNRKYTPVDSIIANTKTNAILKYMEKKND